MKALKIKGLRKALQKIGVLFSVLPNFFLILFWAFW